MSWTPGFRRTPPNLNAKFGDYLLAIAMAGNLKLQVLSGDKAEPRSSDIADDSPSEVGNDVILVLQNNMGKKFSMNLTTLTEKELGAVAGAIEVAIREAETVVKIRDQVAKEAAESGEDIYYRRHRGSPNLSIFTRAISRHAQGIPVRHSNDVAGDATGDNPSGRPGGDSGPVAELEEATDRGEVNGSPDHSS